LFVKLLYAMTWILQLADSTAQTHPTVLHELRHFNLLLVLTTITKEPLCCLSMHDARLCEGSWLGFTVDKCKDQLQVQDQDRADYRRGASNITPCKAARFNSSSESFEIP
jgi:hypothetical protein